MACSLTQGYTLECRDSIGGVKEVHIIELGNLSAITEASGNVSALTKATGKYFQKYEQIKSTSEAMESLKASDENGTIYWEQTVSLQIPKMRASIRNEILLLAQNRVVILVVTREGTTYMYGKTNGLTLSANENKTGKAAGDLNGYTLTFTGWEQTPAPTVASGIVTAAQTPGT